MTFDQFIEAIRHLRVDRSGGVPKPYKPLLLAVDRRAHPQGRDPYRARSSWTAA